MKRRRQTTHEDASQIFETLVAPDAEPAEPPQPTNPAELAAQLLLEALVAQQSVPFTASELIILEVPDDSWMAVTTKMIRQIAYSEAPPPYFPPDEFSNLGGPMKVYRGSQFFGNQFDFQLSGELAAELLAPKTVWIVAEKSKTSHDRFPPDLLASADRQLVLPDFSQEAYTKFLSMVTGTTPQQTWPPAALSELTPTVLRVSVRQNQSADDYARRIAKIVAARRKMGKGENDKKAAEPTTELSLAQIHGMPAEVTEWARSLAMDLKDYKEGNLGWADVDRGAIFWGPPGCGKTTIAKSIGLLCEVPFFGTSYSSWQSNGSGHLGNVTAAIRQVFDEARAAAPCILCIEEADSINSRSSKNERNGDWWRAVINALLEQLDGLVTREGVVVIATSNDPSVIDPSILRSGRIDRQFYVGKPDVEALAKIYQHYLGKAFPADDLNRVAGMSVGLTGADVERIARGARRRARKQRRDVRFEHVFHEIAGELPPPGSRSLWSSAIHEAGHAAVLALQPGRLQLVSIVGSGQSMGGTIGRPVDNGDTTSESIDRHLKVLIAGRAAEEIILGRGTGGCGGPEESDLALASHYAFVAETSLGLGTTGLLWSDVPKMEDLHTRFASQPEAARAARQRIERALAKAKALVTVLRPVIEAIAEALIEKYVLTSDQLNAILTEHGEAMRAAAMADRAE